MALFDNIDLIQQFRVLATCIIIGCIPILWQIGRGLRYEYDIDLTGWYILSFVVIVVIPAIILLSFVWCV